jgi:hypothetical protein
MGGLINGVVLKFKLLIENLRYCWAKIFGALAC